MKKALFLFLVCLFVFLLAGCDGDSVAGSITTPDDTPSTSPAESTPSTTEVAPSATKTPEESTDTPTPPAEIDYTDVYAGYLEYYREYQLDISVYTWGVGDGQVAICDIFGDATPEMLYVAQYTNYEAYLSIYTYIDGSPTRTYYEPIDRVVSSGEFYCLFTTTDGKAILYKRGPGWPMTRSFEELALVDNQLVVTPLFSRKTTPSEDFSTYSDVYEQNGTTISESEFAALESQLVGSAKEITVWSCVEEMDGIVMDKINELGSSAMSAETAIEFLIDAAGVRGEDAPSSVAGDFNFTEGMAIEYLTPAILRGWGQSITEEEIPDRVEYDVTVSDRLYDNQPIYLIKYNIPGVGGGKTLVFADGTTMSKFAAEFANYAGYFESIDITAD